MDLVGARSHIRAGVLRLRFETMATTGSGKYSTSRWQTATGPEPGPPPPCGVERVLCRFKVHDVKT
jgi:hypothetical protein